MALTLYVYLTEELFVEVFGGVVFVQVRLPAKRLLVAQAARVVHLPARPRQPGLQTSKAG